MKRIALIIVIFLAVMIGVISTTWALNGDREALMALFDSTNGPGWTNSTGWGGTDPCDPVWFGLTCDAGNVIRLDLDLNQLTGTLPADLQYLSQVQYISLDENNLSGPIPAELGNLSLLTEIYMEENHLSGPIPPELGKLSNLEQLALYSNELSGSIPPELGNLSSIVEIYLPNNQLSGSIPAELGKLNTMDALDLKNNNLSGPIPASLSDLANITLIYIWPGNANVVCWQTQAALDWAQGTLQFYSGPTVACPFVAMPLVYKGS